MSRIKLKTKPFRIDWTEDYRVKDVAEACWAHLKSDPVAWAVNVEATMTVMQSFQAQDVDEAKNYVRAICNEMMVQFPHLAPSRALPAAIASNEPIPDPRKRAQPQRNSEAIVVVSK